MSKRKKGEDQRRTESALRKFPGGGYMSINTTSIHALEVVLSMQLSTVSKLFCQREWNQASAKHAKPGILKS